MTKPLNSTNEYCNRCGKKTRPLFHSSAMRFCSGCEKDTKEEEEQLDLFVLNIDWEQLEKDIDNIKDK